MKNIDMIRNLDVKELSLFLMKHLSHCEMCAFNKSIYGPECITRGCTAGRQEWLNKETEYEFRKKI